MVILFYRSVQLGAGGVNELLSEHAGGIVVFRFLTLSYILVTRDYEALNSSVLV